MAQIEEITNRAKGKANMKDLEKAKNILSNENASFALVNGEQVFTSKESGVRPLLQLLDENSSMLSGASVADRVVGRAAALLMTLGGVKEVYGAVMSRPGFDALKQHGIGFDLGELVANINNKSKTGLCPMEQACIGTDDPAEARGRIMQAVLSMKKESNS
jgi:hypothetical protein